MSDTSFLGWPFFDASHRNFVARLDQWAGDPAGAIAQIDHRAPPDACRALVRSLGSAGWLQHVVAGASGPLDVRTLCLGRDTLARHDPLADFAFAMQGLGSGPISVFGSPELRARYLPRVAAGEIIAAFALSEPGAGSDVGAMTTTATREGDGWRLHGEKTWISNGGIADFYVVFARIAGADPKQFGAFVVDADAHGFQVAESIETIAPHPLARLTFDGVRVGAQQVVGEPGKGLRVALGTLDVFRSTVGAAALGMARRALDAAVAHCQSRTLFGQRLGEFQLTQSRLAQMATDIDTAALLVYRAAWTKDTAGGRVTREAAMAKWYATEAAQRVIDGAVQLFGGQGVVAGHDVERLYREIRSLRIYEGTSEVQQLVIAGQLLAEPVPHIPHPATPPSRTT